MKLEMRLLNSIWLLVPLLIWNLLLSSQITQEGVLSDANSPRGLLIAENLTRMLVFTLPLLIRLPWRDLHRKAGLRVYTLGVLVYFSSWLPLIFWPESGWSHSPAGLLAPRVTPLVCFAGIALIGRSWPYLGISVIFTLLHTLHGVQNILATGIEAPIAW